MGPIANAAAIPVVGVFVLPVLLAGSLCLSLPGELAKSAGQLLLSVGAHGLDMLWWPLELLAELGPRYSLAIDPSLLATVLAMAGAAILLAPPGLPARWAGAMWFAPLL